MATPDSTPSFWERLPPEICARTRTLADLALLPRVSSAQDSEVHHLLESHRLWGTGLGWVDLHILASAILSGWSLYTGDRAMHAAAARLDIDLISG
jgi:hypothetical protein